MKKVLVLLLISFPLLSVAQLDVFVKYSEGGVVTPDINFYGTKKISKKFSLTYFALMEKSWSEALVGVSYSPVDFLSVGTMIGIESGSNKPRYFGNIWMGKGNTSFLLMTEKGAGVDNYWYRANLYQKLSERFTAGITAWRFTGIGPNLRYRINKLSTTIWVLPAYDIEFKQKRVLLGCNISF